MTPMMTSFRRFLASALALSAVACGGSADSGTVVIPPTPVITLSANTSAVTVTAGTSTTTTLTVARSGGFTGDVALAATGVPTGVTIAFNPASITASATTSVMTIAVGSTAVAGTNSITVSASGTGVTTKTITVALTVPTTAPTPAITLTAGASALTAVAGTSGTVPLTITRVGSFTSDVALAATGLPAGVTAAFAPATLTAGATSSTLTLTVAAGTAATTGSVVVTASGTGVTAQTATIALTVTASSTPDFALTASPASLSIVNGQSGTSTLTVARTGGFAGNVTLALEGAPAGVTGVFAPNPATAGSSTLTITTTTTAVAGMYNLVVRGTATGQSDRTTVIALTVAPVPSITLAVGSPTLTAAVGTTATSTVTIVRIGSVTGDIALTAENLPTGVTASFAPATLTAGVSTSTLTLTVGSTAVAAATNITVRATGAGVTAQTGVIAFTVTPAQGITVAGNAVSIQQGATGASTVTITRIGGFTGTVNLAITGLPSGVTATFTPAAVVGTTSSLSFVASAAATAGSFNPTITATAAGGIIATATVSLTVTTASTGGSAVAYRFCATDGIPTFFAFRNGATGSWTPVTIGANSTFNFSLTGATGQVAYAVPSAGSGVSVQVLLYATSEFPGIAAQQCVTNPLTKSVTGTVAGLGAGQTAAITLGNGSDSVSANGAFTITGATDGASDLIAIRSSFNIATGKISQDRVIIRRNLNPAAGASIGAVLDFGSAEAVAPATASYTVANVNGETIFASNTFQTANGSAASFANFTANQTSPVTLFGVPSSLTQAGDFHAATVFASTSTSASSTTSRGVFQYNKDVAARTVTLGATPTAPTLTSLASAPFARPRVQGTWQSDYADVVNGSFTQSNTRTWVITGSRAYFGTGSSTFDFDVPDLSGVAGFNNSWGLVSGTSTVFQFNVFGGFRGLTAITENSSFKFGGRMSTITP